MVKNSCNQLQNPKIPMILSKDGTLLDQWKSFLSTVLNGRNNPGFYKQLERNLLLDHDYMELFRNILTKWENTMPQEANLENLMTILESFQCSGTVEKLKSAFCENRRSSFNSNETRFSLKNADLPQRNPVVDIGNTTLQDLNDEDVSGIWRSLHCTLEKRMSDPQIGELKSFAYESRIINCMEHRVDNLAELLLIIGNRSSQQIRIIIKFIYEMEENEHIREFINNII